MTTTMTECELHDIRPENKVDFGLYYNMLPVQNFLGLQVQLFLKIKLKPRDFVTRSDDHACYRNEQRRRDFDHGWTISGCTGAVQRVNANFGN